MTALRCTFLIFWLMGAIIILFVLFAFVNPYSKPILFMKALWARFLLWAFGFSVTVEGKPKEGAVLNVGNHITWADPMILAAYKTSSYLIKDEVNSWPLVGRMGRMTGSIYIKRGAGQVYQRVEDIAQAIKNGGTIGVYPEATTTDGSDVKSFAPPLFKVITEQGMPMQLVGIFYPNPSGKGCNPIIPYIGDQSFGENISLITGMFKPKKVILKFFDFDAMPNESDVELAERAHKVLQAWIKSFQ